MYINTHTEYWTFSNTLTLSPQLLKEFFHAVYIAGYVQVFRTSFRVQKK